ncbi:hypothetical protein [Absidia glauca]|uniref:Uncharacterized protein n=1 Tax=Absidia glauca TaxID=4829 RepID=A0A163JCH9_ABSGL|nr:hypothetical protein [Absidia glauca]
MAHLADKISPLGGSNDHGAGWDHEPTRWNVFKLELHAQEGRASMHMPLDCESKSEAHGGDKLMTLLKRKGKGDGLCLLTAMGFAFQTVESQF